MKFLLPISYLGNIEYFSFLIQKDVIIDQNEYFIKQSLRNRCKIYGSNGELELTVPKIRKGSNKTAIKDIKISYAETWKRKHINAIKSAYNSSPFCKYYIDDIQDVYMIKESNLLKFNLNLTNKILLLLNVDKKISLTSKFIKKFDGKDLRDYKFTSKATPIYSQVFDEKHGFIPNLSILDLIFNIGPSSRDYLENTII